MERLTPSREVPYPMKLPRVISFKLTLWLLLEELLFPAGFILLKREATVC